MLFYNVYFHGLIHWRLHGFKKFCRSIINKFIIVIYSLLVEFCFPELATECETPNGDIGFCVEIKNCSKLLKQLKNQNAKQFLFQSKCGPDNEEPTNPKVCCGKYATFKNKIHNQRKTQSIISMNSNTNIVPESIEGSHYDNRPQIIAAGEESDGSEEPTKSLC